MPFGVTSWFINSPFCIWNLKFCAILFPLFSIWSYAITVLCAIMCASLFLYFNFLAIWLAFLFPWCSDILNMNCQLVCHMLMSVVFHFISKWELSNCLPFCSPIFVPYCSEILSKTFQLLGHLFSILFPFDSKKYKRFKQNY